MGENKKYYWLKLKEDFFRDKEIKKLRRIAGGDTYTIIYLKLQLLSLKREGKLIFENLEDSFAEEMALELDENTENVKMTLLYLQKCGLIEELAENEYMLPQAIMSIGTETQGAERTRRHRENKKALQCNTQALLSDTTVTNCNTEIERREKREDIYIKEIEKNTYTQDFETWYGSYPNKFNKAQTFKNWKSILKEETKENIIAATAEYLKYIKSNKIESKYIVRSTNFVGQKQEYKGYLKENTPLTMKSKVQIVEGGYLE